MNASDDAKEPKLTIRQRRSKGSNLSIVTGISPSSGRGAKSQTTSAREHLKAKNAVTEKLDQREVLLRENELRSRAHRPDRCIQDLTQPGPLTSRMLAWDGVPFTPLILNRKIVTAPAQHSRNPFLPLPNAFSPFLHLSRPLLLRIFSLLADADAICLALTCKPFANLSRRLNGGQGIYYTPAGRLHLLLRLEAEMKRKGRRLCMGSACEKYYKANSDEWWEPEGRKRIGKGRGKGREYEWRGMKCPACVKKDEEQLGLETGTMKAKDAAAKGKGRRYLCF